MVSMTFDISARSDAERAFLADAAAAETLKKKLDALDRTRVEPKADLNITAASAKIAQLKGRLDELRNVRARVDVDGAAEARREVSRLVVELRKLTNQNVKVRLDAGDTKQQITTIRDRLRAIRDVDVKLKIDSSGEQDANRLSTKIMALRQLSPIRLEVRVDEDGKALARLAELKAAAIELGRTRPTIQVTTDTATAAARIADLERRLAQLGGKQYTANVKADIDKSVSDRVNELGKGLLKLGSAAGVATLALGSTVPAVASLAGSLVSLVGLAPVAVGGLAALGAVTATVKAGLIGMDEAFKSLDDPKKFAEALKELAPAGRDFATSVRDVKTAFDGVRLDVQQRLFAGWGAEVRSIGTTYLPLLRTEMGGVATELNKTGTEIAAFAKMPATIRDVDAIFTNTRTALIEARPAATNLLNAFRDIAAVGSAELPSLASGVTNVTGRFKEFIAQARQSGQLGEWIQSGVDTLQTLGSVAGNVGSALYSVFSAAKASGADFLSTLDRVTASIADLLRSAQGQNALTSLFTTVRGAVDALLPGVAALAKGVLEAISAFANTGGLEAATRAISAVAEAVAPLLPTLGQLAGQTLGMLADGAMTAAKALTPIVQGVSAVVDALGPVAPLILACVVAFKALGTASAAMVAMGTRVAGAAAAVGTYAGSLTGSATAGTAASTATTRLGSAISGLGKALPIAGAAFVAGGVIVEHYASQVKDASQALADGSISAQQAFQQFNGLSLDNLGRSIATTIPGLNLFVDSSFAAWEKTVDGANKATQAMTPLQLAQRDLTVATREYGDALKSNDPARVAAASEQLAAANARVAEETNKVAEASKSAAEKQRDLVSSAQSVLSSMLNLKTALADVETAQKQANEASAKYGKNSAEAAAANNEFVRKADAAAQAAQRDAAARAQAAGATDAATVGTHAYGAALLQQAATASGPARDALLGYISNLGDSELAALSAGAEASGFATTLLTLPNGKSVKIAVDPETGKIITTQQLLDGLKDKTVTINGNTVPLEQALGLVLQAIAAGQGTVTINGQTVPADQALRELLGRVDVGQGTVTVNGQSAPADKVLQAYIAAINSGSGTVTINGQDVPAQDVLKALLSTVLGSKPNITVGAVDNASPVIDNAARDRTATIYVKSVVLNQPSASVRVAGQQEYARGAIVSPMAHGGLIANAPGRYLRPMSGSFAQIVPPNTWRVVGDRLRDDEAFIPLNASRRSRSILGQAADRMGYGLVPRSASRYLQAAFAGRAGVTRDELLGGSRAVGSVVTPIAAAGGSFAGLGALRADLAEVQAAVRALGPTIERQTEAVRTARPITVEDRSGNPVETARAVQLAARFRTR
ncbi:hypothetical protein [Pseudonocardia dioxanivorans]|uniref:hypothetical protein n=1 Tax=Pseudonocardia dioxanivorans TaxID=240495 RepID=UPI000CD2F1BE|nr:hypothetical protein [Pseudonocardia dioxanivorans]